MEDGEVRLRAGDLYRFCIQCTTCRSDTPLDGRVERDASEVIMCLNCGMPLTGANTMLAAYRAYLTELEAANPPVYFVLGRRE